MSVEQRVVAALRQAEQLEPSPDLWSRVVHSIDEDRQHRRRVRSAVAAVAGTALVLVAIAALSMRDGPLGRFVHRPTLELLEAGTLVGLAVVLGPAIRRFGRGYAADLWPPASHTPAALLRLLDLAYYLVLSGYVLLTTELEFGAPGTSDLLAGQIQEAFARVGGLLLIVGLLHATTLMALPVVALIDNSTRTGRALPRWIVIGLVLVGVGGALLVIPNLIGLIVAGTS